MCILLSRCLQLESIDTSQPVLLLRLQLTLELVNEKEAYGVVCSRRADYDDDDHDGGWSGYLETFQAPTGQCMFGLLLGRQRAGSLHDKRAIHSA